MDETRIDAAHAAMQAEPENDRLRMRFYERLAEAELFLLLDSDPAAGAEDVTPELFDLGSARYVLVFDREERLAQFAGRVAPYIALSGRSIALMLHGQGLGIGLNLEVAPSSIFLPPEAVDWLNTTLGNAPTEVDARVQALHAPSGLPDSLIEALDGKLAAAMGLAERAYVAGVTYEDGVRGHLLAYVGAVPEAEPALARAAAEALTFSGIEAGAMDVVFLRAADPVTARLEKVGLRFDLPQLQKPVSPGAPGTDPARPPKLR
jgi:hypothetical protein